MTTVADLTADLRLRPDKGSFAAGDRLISGIKGAIGGLAAMAGLNWAKNVIGDTIQTADKFDELAQQTGVNVESLQALTYAAGFSGLNVEALSSSLGFLGKNADAAARGSKAQAQAFRRVGVDAKSLINGTLSAEDALGKIADRFSKMKDGQDKSNLSMRLFGKSGKALIPFLNAGSKGIAALTAEARELGVVMDGDTIKAMAGVADQQDKIGAMWTGIKNQAVAALLPVLQEVFQWVLDHRKEIGKFFSTLGKGIRMAAKIIGVVVGKIVSVAEWLADKLGISAESIGVIGAALLALAPIIGIVGAALGSAFGGPLIAIVLIATAVAGLIAFLKEVTFEDIKKKAAQFIEWARDAANSIGRGVKRAVRDAVDAVPGGKEARGVAADLVTSKASLDFNPFDSTPLITRKIGQAQGLDAWKQIRLEQDAPVTTPSPTTVVPDQSTAALWAQGTMGGGKTNNVTVHNSIVVNEATDAEGIQKQFVDFQAAVIEGVTDATGDDEP